MLSTCFDLPTFWGRFHKSINFVLKKERDNTKDQTHVDFCHLILQLLIHAMYISVFSMNFTCN